MLRPSKPRPVKLRYKAFLRRLSLLHERVRNPDLQRKVDDLIVLSPRDPASELRISLPDAGHRRVLIHQRKLHRIAKLLPEPVESLHALVTMSWQDKMADQYAARHPAISAELYWASNLHHLADSRRRVLKVIRSLRIFGSSRSGRKDFQETVDFYNNNPEVVNLLEYLVGEVIDVREVEDFTRAFEADIAKAGGKTIMIWNK